MESETADLRGPARKGKLARLGAALLLDGSVAREGDRLTVRVRLEDAPSSTVLWSETFFGPASAPSVLETQVASKAVDLVNFARKGRGDTGGRDLDPSVMAEYVQANEQMAYNFPTGFLKATQILRHVIVEAPRFAAGHGTLAVSEALAGRLLGNHSIPREQEVRAQAATLDRAIETVPQHELFRRSVVTGDRQLEISYDKDKATAGEVMAKVQALGWGIVDVTTREADLEDVFVALTSAGAPAQDLLATDSPPRVG
jgi:hypothetical protein